MKVIILTLTALVISFVSFSQEPDSILTVISENRKFQQADISLYQKGNRFKTYLKIEKSEEYYFYFDSFMNFEEIYFSNYVVNQSFLSGKLEKIDSNRYRLNCQPPDSIPITVHEYAINDHSKDAYFEIFKNPWTFSDIFRLRIIINKQLYSIEESQNYRFVVPKDTIKKYKEFFIQYGFSKAKTKKYRIIDSVTNYFIVDIPDYNRNTEYYLDWYNNNYPFCNQEVTLNNDNTIDLFISPLNSTIRLKKAEFVPIDLWLINKLKSNRMNLH